MTHPVRRSRRLRIALVVVAAAVLLLAAAGIALVRAFPPERLSALLMQKAEAATGRPLRVGGGLSLRLLPTIAVVANDVAFGNAAWGSRPDMVTVRRMAFEIAPWPLVHGEIEILSVDLDGADLLLESDGHGRYNWMLDRPATPAAPAAAASAVPPPLEVNRLTISDARIAYRDGADGVARAVSVEALTLQREGGRNQVSGTFGDGRVSWRLESRTGLLDALLLDREDWPFELRLSADGASASASGTVGGGPRRGQVQAQLALRIAKPAALALLVDDPAVLPLPIDAAFSVRRDADTVQADPLRLTVAGQPVNGKLRWRTTAGAERIDAELAAPAIDLTPWFGKSAPGAATRAGAALFGDVPIALPPLPPIPVHVDLRIDRLIAPGMPPLSTLSAGIAAADARLVVDPLNLMVADGEARGRFELVAAPLPRLSFQVAAKALSLPTLAVALGREGAVHSGRASLDATLALSGRSARELAASATGSVSLRVSNAELAGSAAVIEHNIVIALVQALLPRQESKRAPRLDCAVVALPLRQGVARIDRSIALETEQIAVAASGELNLKTQTVALEFRPTVKKGIGLNTASLAQLVRIDGPLANPAMRIDMKGTAREAAVVGVAVATGGLSLIGSRMLAKPDDSQACRRAAQVAAQGSGSAAAVGR